MRALTEFWDAAGQPLRKIPQVSGRELDLHLLYTQVKRRGGFEKASADRKWGEIAEGMNMHETTTSHLSTALKKHYQQLLLPYESRPVHAPPAAAPAASVAPPSSGGGPSAADAASAAAGREEGLQVVSSGGGLMAKRGLGGGGGGSGGGGGGSGGLLLPAVGEVVKLSSGGVERSNAEVEEVIAYEPPLPGEEMCEVCGGGGDNAAMLLCDRCSCGFHMYCLTPALTSVPAGEWFCSMCLNESFGFGSTRVFKFHQYERQAHAFKHAFFESLYDTGTAHLSKKAKAQGIAHSAEERARSSVRLPELDVPAEEVCGLGSNPPLRARGESQCEPA